MPDPSVVPEEQLLRQVGWLKESWSYLLRRHLDLGERDDMVALDVGCGPGLVMLEMQSLIDVRGIDRDASMIARCRDRGLAATVGTAEELPYEDGSFDLVYCSFLLLWLVDPIAALREMRRVSKGPVVCLAEPDYGGMVLYPPSLQPLVEQVVQGMAKQGAEPFMGRRLGHCFRQAGMEPMVGVHPGGGLRPDDAGREWENLLQMMGGCRSDPDLKVLEREWMTAAHQGSLSRFCPTFYAIAKL